MDAKELIDFLDLNIPRKRIQHKTNWEDQTDAERFGRTEIKIEVATGAFSRVAELRYVEETEESPPAVVMSIDLLEYWGMER